MQLTHGVFRPRESCLMKDEKSAFCEPCREALVLALAAKVKPFAFSAQQRGNRIHLTVTSIVPGPVRAKWFLGSQALSQGRAEVVIAKAQLSWRRSWVTAEVHDATPFVRKDQGQVLREIYQWKLGHGWGDSVRVKQSRRRPSSIPGSLSNPVLGRWPALRYPNSDSAALIKTTNNRGRVESVNTPSIAARSPGIVTALRSSTGTR
jgi:hypothetical protein